MGQRPILDNSLDRCLDLGPWTRVQGSGKVAGKVLTVDLQGWFAKLLI